ncbi:hypothetical protein N9X34_02160 [Alphaproteobacteria bacterium]|nr:hypothetical protein [Alphaproteobacteria bacterium]
MEVFIECNDCSNLNPTDTIDCNQCEKNLTGQKIVVHYLDKKSSDAFPLLQTTHEPFEKGYHEDLIDFFYLDYICLMNKHEEYNGYFSNKLFQELYSIMTFQENITHEKAILKLTKILLKVQDVNNKRLPWFNREERNSFVQVFAAIIGGMFILNPDLLSNIKKNWKNINVRELSTKIGNLCNPLMEKTLQKSLPKDVNAYPFMLVTELYQELRAIDNLYKR